MTIEQRVKEYANKYIVGDSAMMADCIYNIAKEAYIAGANEQKKIDTDKICEVIIYELMHEHNCDIPNIEKTKEYIKQKIEE